MIRCRALACKPPERDESDRAKWPAGITFDVGGNMLDASQWQDVKFLKSLMGRQVLFHGRQHAVIEILPDEGQLVLQDEHHNIIQDNAYGRAYRRVHETVMVPIFIRPDTLNPDLDFLQLLD